MMLSAAYHTIIMRAAGDADPGHTFDATIDTVLAFTA